MFDSDRVTGKNILTKGGASSAARKSTPSSGDHHGSGGRERQSESSEIDDSVYIICLLSENVYQLWLYWSIVIN